MINRTTSTGIPPSTMAVLMLSVFTVSVGYGIILPLLPYLIERLLGKGGGAAQVSQATGLLTGLYTLSLFLFAPAWGRMSDRYVRRPIRSGTRHQARRSLLRRIQPPRVQASQFCRNRPVYGLNFSLEKEHTTTCPDHAAA